MSLGNKTNGAVNIVMIMVALAIIATIAIPGYVDSKSKSNNTLAVEGIADVLGSASAINYAVRNIRRDHGVPIKNCVDVVKALEGPLDAKFTIYSASINSGTKTMCTVTDDSGNKATFVAQGIR